MPDLIIWGLILLCLTQSAMFSGLNLALFSLPRLQLDTEVKKGNPDAVKIARMRSDANLLLCTILWGNVSVNVLLTILADSVVTGVFAFLFSTVGITFFGEIMPQAYFSRHALRMGSFLSPVVRFYRTLLYPVAKPCAMLLDRWIGPEGTRFFREADLEVLLDQHIREPSSDISYAEGRGALNFLRLDDLRISGEGSPLDPDAVLSLPTQDGRAYLPSVESEEGREMTRRISATDKKWIVLTDEDDWPCHALNGDDYLRAVASGTIGESFEVFCQEPIVSSNPDLFLDRILTELDVESEASHDRVLTREVVIYWGERRKRIITGPDLLGRLLHGVVPRRNR